MQPITLSVFDIFKIGPGPSSSHTIGPINAALSFRDSLNDLSDDLFVQADSIKTILLGSLSATGKGHGTDRAVMAGLLGFRPESIDPGEFDRLLTGDSDGYETVIRNRRFHLKGADIQFGPIEHDHPYNNTLVFKLEKDGKTLFEKVYYSVGGGMIEWEGYSAAELGEPVYKYDTMAELQKLCAEAKISLPDLVIANESAITGASKEEIDRKLNDILAVMEKAVQNGLHSDGPLPGPIGLNRKARPLIERSDSHGHLPGRLLILLNAYALAAAEENAAGHIVVTAPTLGSAGVMPAVIHLLRKQFLIEPEKIKQGLLTAAAIGFLVKHNASIAGADVGCQGEIGTASAMAAGLLCQTHGYPLNVTANAAEIALEHHLGLTCDPVGGYVQIPCIERNAMGAVKAYNSFILASTGLPESQKVTFDQVVKVMLETGRDMSGKYKETSLGGLAVSFSSC